MKYEVKLYGTRCDEQYYEAIVEVEAGDPDEAQDKAFTIMDARENSPGFWEYVGEDRRNAIEFSNVAVKALATSQT